MRTKGKQVLVSIVNTGISIRHLNLYSVDTQSTSQLTPHQHSIDSWSIVGRMSTESYISIGTEWYVCKNKLTFNRLLTEIFNECQSLSGDRVVSRVYM